MFLTLKMIDLDSSGQLCLLCVPLNPAPYNGHLGCDPFSTQVPNPQSFLYPCPQASWSPDCVWIELGPSLAEPSVFLFAYECLRLMIRLAGSWAGRTLIFSYIEAHKCSYLFFSSFFFFLVVSLNNGNYQYSPTFRSTKYRPHMRKYIALHLTLGVTQMCFLGFFFKVQSESQDLQASWQTM